MELTILMPCLNEAGNLAYSIEQAKQFLLEQNIDGEILLADNGSTDDSVAIATELGARVITVATKGYGATLRAGILAAKGTYIILGDCDSTYDFYHLDAYMDALRGGASLVMGNRFAGGIAKGAMPFSHRYIGVPFLSLLGRLRYHVKVQDFHCGLRGLNTAHAKQLEFTTIGMEFATEMIACFAKNGFSICQVPTTLSVSQKPRKAHIRTIRDGLRHLKYMLFT